MCHWLASAGVARDHAGGRVAAPHVQCPSQHTKCLQAACSSLSRNQVGAEVQSWSRRPWLQLVQPRKALQAGCDSNRKLQHMNPVFESNGTQ